MTKAFLKYLHPSQSKSLKGNAREKYKYEQWEIRYNRWRASRGESPCQETEAEVGVFEGVNFRCHQQ